MLVIFYPLLAKAQDKCVELGIVPNNLTYEELMSSKPIMVFEDYIELYNYERKSTKLSRFLQSVKLKKPYEVVDWCYYKRYNIKTQEEILQPSLTAWEKFVMNELIAYNSKVYSGD